MKAQSFQIYAYLLSWTFRFSSASPLLSHTVEELAPVYEDSALRRRQSGNGTFVVTGIQNAGVQPRLEIRELEQDADAWNLYLLGMRRFQATDQTDKFSYYRLCGIHGMPYEAWDKVESTGNSQAGYCGHMSNIFLTWHRPYLVLYEQILFDHVLDAANSFPSGAVRERYLAAARRWRMPYWDWAAEPEDGSSVYPDSVRTPTIAVTLPNGTATIRNPLYSYRFHPLSVQDFVSSPWASWPETMRDPTNRGSNAVTQNDRIAAILDNSRNSRMNRLFNLFAHYRNFAQFSNEAWMVNNVGNADSLESVHDDIHDAIGGDGGHMTYPDYSAFDPVFWLHHTMMDRCLSLWQAVNNYTGQVDPARATSETYMIKMGDTIGADSPLGPFHKDIGGAMFTSNDVMRTDSFGYTYPELIDDADRSSVIVKIRGLYGSNAVAGGPLRGAVEVSQAATKQEVNTAPGEILSNGCLQHYAASIVSQKFALTGSYAIYLFLGDVQTDDPKAWPLSPNLAGTHAVFAGSSKESNLDSIKRPIGYGSAKVSGSIPLTDPLLSKLHNGDLSGMSNEDVEAYLQKNLTWRIAMMDGTVVDPDDVADLEVTVVSAQIQRPAAEDEFPSWHNFTELASVTHGRPGGHRG